jgi:hypothetical protein
MERQARQQFRHERRQRLEKSYSDLVNVEQPSNCPTCHTSSDPARHSICCLARKFPSRQQMDDQLTLNKDEAMYESNFFKSTRRQNEAEMDIIPTTSLSSGYRTAEPCLSQQPENEFLSSGKAGEHGLCIDIETFEISKANKCDNI